MHKDRRNTWNMLFVGVPLPRVCRLRRVDLHRSLNWEPTGNGFGSNPAESSRILFHRFRYRNEIWRRGSSGALSASLSTSAEADRRPGRQEATLRNGFDDGHANHASSHKIGKNDVVSGSGPLLGNSSFRSSHSVEQFQNASSQRNDLHEQSRLSSSGNATETLRRDSETTSRADNQQDRHVATFSEASAVDLTVPFPRPARLRILLIGKPASGKGTQAPLIARRFGMVHISMGSLLRNEVRAKTALGVIAEEYMNRGELVPDDLVLAILKTRLAQEDCRENGYILDGFPRTLEQAQKLDAAGVLIDHVIVLERADADALDWARERLIDPITGMMYHPRLAPAPPHIVHRLERRSDDNVEIMKIRLEQYAREAPHILSHYRNNLTVVQTHNARPYLDAFREISQILERLILRNTTDELWHFCADQRSLWRPRGRRQVTLPRGALLESLETFASRIREKDYVPLYAGPDDDAPQIGLVGRIWASELLSADIHHEVFDVQLESCSIFGPNTAANNGFIRFRSNVTTEKLDQVMMQLRDRGLVEGWRNERVPLRLGPGRHLEIERACMAYLGVETTGVHVNGYFYRPGDRGAPELYVWLARRSWNKPTYPGRLDQLTAGGVPATAVSVLGHAMQELHDEASYTGRAPTPVGCLRYRYETRKGVSAKVLYLYDLELDEQWTPRSLDAEVETFFALSAKEALASLVEARHEWKPNSALVLMDFLIRFGVIHADNEPDYADIVTRIRCCGI